MFKIKTKILIHISIYVYPRNKFKYFKLKNTIGT